MNILYILIKNNSKNLHLQLFYIILNFNDEKIFHISTKILLLTPSLIKKTHFLPINKLPCGITCQTFINTAPGSLAII